jgi:molybdate transport system permease protein
MSDLRILLFTIEVAAISTLLIAPIALLLAAWSWRAGSRTRAVIDAFGSLPLVLPPTAVGFVLLELLSRNRLLGRALAAMHVEVVFTPAAVVLASAVMSFPLMFLAFRAAIDSSDLRYFQIARTLGASPAKAFVRVTLPLAWRGLASGLLLAFCRALGEFGATILIAGNIPGRTQTLALAIYERVQSGRVQSAFPLLGAAVILAFASIFVSEALMRQQRRRLSA